MQGVVSFVHQFYKNLLLNVLKNHRVLVCIFVNPFVVLKFRYTDLNLFAATTKHSLKSFDNVDVFLQKWFVDPRLLKSSVSTFSEVFSTIIKFPSVLLKILPVQIG